MQTTKEQEQTIHWSLLHEPGDSVARQIFDQRGVAALDDFETGAARRLWPTLVGPEYHQAVLDMIERIELRWSPESIPRLIECGIR